MIPHLTAALVAVVLLTAVPAVSRAVPIVTAGSDTVSVDDTFTIPISITDAIELISWQFDLSFDPAILRATAVSEGPFLSESGTKTTLFIPGAIDNSTGRITLVADSFLDLPPGPSGNGVLADIEFQALAIGVSPLTLSNVFLNFVDSGFQSVDGQVIVLGPGTPVPEPGTLGLVAAGLGACAARCWRRSRRGAARSNGSRLHANRAGSFSEPQDRREAIMRLKAVLLVAAILPAITTLNPIPALAQTTAPGPYYATPAWDQQLQCGTQANCPRFIVLSNWRDANFPSGGAAVLDRETGLVWERSPSAEPPSSEQFTRWQAAQTHCNQLGVGSRRGWRLPTVQELASLIDPTVPPPGPTLPAWHPFSNVQPALYWSATTLAADTSLAWGVFFNGGTLSPGDVTRRDVVFAGKTNLGILVWCVRGGQGVDPQ